MMAIKAARHSPSLVYSEYTPEHSLVMRLQSTLALILLTAVSVQGGPIMGSGEQEETEVHAGQLSFTPSTGTLESLLEELGQDLSGIVQVR